MKHRVSASRTCLVFVAGCVLAAASLCAAEAPTITVSKSDTLSLAVQPISGPGGATNTRLLQNDLALSGYFNLAPPASAGFIAGGNIGTSLEGRVTDHSGKIVVSRSYDGSPRERVHAFADDIIETLTGNRGFLQSRIAFVATATGRKEIYLADADGMNQQQLTHDNGISVGPRLSPDGKELVYTGYQSGYADVYKIDLGAGSRQRIIKFPGTNTGAVFSPDGRRLAVTLSKDGATEIYVTGADGGGAHRLTRTPGVKSCPTWSPDGAEIIYSAQEEGSPRLYRVPADGGGSREISTNYGYCTEPNWSPDGKKVAFNVREGGVFQVAVLDLENGSSRVVTSGGDAEAPAWGADSRHLLFAGGGGLYMLDVQTGKKVRLIEGLGKISEPTWSR